MEYLMVGQLIKPQGIKGEIKVKPMTDDVNRFLDLINIYLEMTDGSYKIMGIESVRTDAKFAYIVLDGVNDRNSAEEYRGMNIWIDKQDAVELPKGRFYIFDLIGCTVTTKDNRELGKVTDVLHTGSNDVYVVKGKHRDILLPALKAIMNVDIDGRLITVDQGALEGLIEDED